MRTAAVLPIKSFSRAKSRLGDGLDRGELAAAMTGDVLSALAATPGLSDVIVVTAEPLAPDTGVILVSDPDEKGQSAAAQRGIDVAVERGAERVLLVPGDCPTLDPDELGSLLDDRPEPPHVTVVPDRHGSGTNALLLVPPGAVAPSFGAGSMARHAARARAAGATVKVRALPSLGLDVDTADDVAALRAALAARRELAPRTRALLARLVPAGVS
ncbi:MAG TPA: 2-phospho-L-lactate guanylyltransferase [Solirubrobacteraceae bacterium]|nr:2-phospho-L-lactate guanylyltransferase [Solirubrobacteraceae bacterium]